jgi:hypothetical protein
MAKTFRRRLWVGPLLLASWFQGGCYLMDKKPADVSKDELVPPKKVDDAQPPAPPRKPDVSRLPEPKALPIAHTDDFTDLPREDLSQRATVTRLPQTPSNVEGEPAQDTPARSTLTIVKNLPAGSESHDPPEIVANNLREPADVGPIRQVSSLQPADDPTGPPRVDMRPRTPATTNGGRLGQPGNENRPDRNSDLTTKARSDDDLKAREAQHARQLDQRDEALRASNAELQKVREQLESSQRDIDRLRAANSELNQLLGEASLALEKKLKDLPQADH